MDFRPIEGTDGRFVISTEGIVMDMHPSYMDHLDWGWETIDPTKPREVSICKDLFSYTLSDGRERKKDVFKVIKETFPDIYDISDETRERILSSFANDAQRTYSISLDDFNKIIYPNELIHLYDTTCNSQTGRQNGRVGKPSVIRPNARGMIVLKKGRKYFGIGRRNLIHFGSDGLPYNANPWAESPSSSNMNQKKGKKDYEAFV